jgi:alkylation response protein AidB-like acyl-CoA dehydrogenase
MGRLCTTDDLTEIQQDILRTVRDFVDEQILPVATDLEHDDEYPVEYEIERLYREAPMLLIGEGTADIQRMIIGRRLLEDYALR